MKPKILILCKSFYNDPDHIHTKKFDMLNEFFRGEFIGLTTNKEYTSFLIKNFRIRCLYLPGFAYRSKMFVNLCFAIYTVFSTIYRHYFVSKYDVVVAEEPLFVGPLAMVISKITGAKLIVEFNGNYSNEHVWKEIKNSTTRRFKKYYLKKMIPFVLRRSHVIKTLYDSQLDPYIDSEQKSKLNIYRFHDYTPLPTYEPAAKTENFIMTMGYPYNIKGFDLLIQAFNRICDRHPKVELHLVGYLNDTHRDFLETFRGGNPRIKFVKPVTHPEAMKKMSKCLFFVLASRTEGMGRVLLEAMALKKALIGSNVDGIPTYAIDNFNSLLFESENITELSIALSKLLDDEEYRDELAERGYAYTASDLSEKSYIDQYSQMILSLGYNK